MFKPKFHYADFATKSRTSSAATQITLPTFMICVRDFVTNLSRTLSQTFPVHCNGLNSIRATQTGLSRTCQHLDMSRWFVSATFVICVQYFPHGEVSVKVSVMEFELYFASWHTRRSAVGIRRTAAWISAHWYLWLITTATVLSAVFYFWYLTNWKGQMVG